jgi:hypothetical protein
MPAINEQIEAERQTDHLVNQKQALQRHIVDLERQLTETGQHLAAVEEHIMRLRKQKSVNNSFIMVK